VRAKIVSKITIHSKIVSSLLISASAAAAIGCGAQPPLPPPPPSPPPVASYPPPAPPPAAPSATPDAPFRENPPPPGPVVAWTPPKIDSWTLPNGVRVLFVERHDLPIVSVRVVGTSGAGDLAGLRAGTTAFMGAMLEQGAGKRNALTLSDDFEAIGAEHSARCDWDACVAHAKVLASHLGPALDLVADVVLHPTFPEAEVDRLRKRWLAALEQEKNSPPAMEQNALAVSLFGRAHPYGNSLRGTTAIIEKVTRGEIEAAWRRAFAPRSTAIVVAGDVTADALRPMLQAHFGGWAGGAATRTPVPHAPPSKGKNAAKSVVLVDVPGAAQSQVYVAEEGVPISTPDRTPLRVMNLILGGLFSSRINLDLRETHAYTYGAGSRFAMRHGAGPFTAGGAMFADHTVDAILEIQAQIARIRDEAVTADELVDAKEHAKLALPARFESVDEVTDALEDIAVYGFPLDEYATLAARVDAVTAGDVQRVAKQWLRPDAMRLVVTGDRAKIEKGLSALGPVELRDAFGDLVVAKEPAK
jgi:zinc protease